MTPFPPEVFEPASPVAQGSTNSRKVVTSSEANSRRVANHPLGVTPRCVAHAWLDVMTQSVRPPVDDGGVLHRTFPLLARAGRVIVFAIYVLVIVDCLLMSMAFVLQLLGASTEAGFTRWVYRSTERAMQPFRGIFPIREIDSRSVLDTSLLFGAIIYCFVAVFLGGILDWLRARIEQQELRKGAASVYPDRVEVRDS